MVLETRFVHDLRAEDLGVADLHRVFGGIGVVPLGRKAELPTPLLVSVSR